MKTIILLDFQALNLTFHLFAQGEIFSKSLFRIPAVSVGSLPKASREQSSANIKISLSSPTTISLIKIKNYKGPNLEPCGTPALISIMWDFAPSTTVYCFLSDRYDLNKVSKEPDIPICSSFARSLQCQTLSKAADISKKQPCAMLPLPQLVLIWCTRYNNNNNISRENWD